MSDEELLVQCRCGQSHWGKYGAAGLLIFCNDKVLLQLRSHKVHQRGTWSIPGGARRKDEDFSNAAYRETQEELGFNPGKIIIKNSIVLDHIDWQYITFVAFTDEELEVSVDRREVEEAVWIPKEKVSSMVLHKDFRNMWDAAIYSIPELFTEDFKSNSDE